VELEQTKNLLNPLLLSISYLAHPRKLFLLAA
jgi:hypothetical protein